jgi:hypothetical protein
MQTSIMGKSHALLFWLVGPPVVGGGGLLLRIDDDEAWIHFPLVVVGKALLIN